jgi:hypothetical protein
LAESQKCKEELKDELLAAKPSEPRVSLSLYFEIPYLLL